MSFADNIVYQMQHTASLLTRFSDLVLHERLNIGFTQYRILMVLQYTPNIQQRSIAESLDQSEAAVSRQIKLMRRQGLLTVESRIENKREHITKLTKKGERLVNEASMVLNNVYTPIFQRYSEKQLILLTETHSDIQSRIPKK